jgi:6,7-dimethyl-8-ribityllumazine synthase
MSRSVEGKLLAEGLRLAVVVSRFNGFITEQLLKGAMDALTRHGARDDSVEVYKVPGAFELPAATKRVAALRRHDGIVVLGALIRGGTAHFDLLATEVTRGLMSVALEGDCAISFGVLTCDTLEQAIERAGTKAGNKGFDAAVAVIEMANLLKEVGSGRKR